MWPKLAQAIINRNKVIGGDNPAGLNLFVITYTALETPHSDSDLGGVRAVGASSLLGGRRSEHVHERELLSRTR